MMLLILYMYLVIWMTFLISFKKIIYHVFSTKKVENHLVITLFPQEMLIKTPDSFPLQQYHKLDQ